MKIFILPLACFGIFSTAALACTSNTQLISTTEVSRMEIHRGGVDAPVTGPTEGDYITWYSSFGQIKKVYQTTYQPNPRDPHPNCPATSTTTLYSDEIMYNMCPTCGTNAGYELKIFSKQDPRTEKLDKPVMIVPGFDPDYGSTSASDFDTYAGMMSLVYDENQPSQVKVPNQNFLKDLYDENYDIVFIKFYHPNIDININAKVLEQAMVWLNSKSSTRSGDEPAILGASMGGLVVRQMLQNAGKVQGPNGGSIKSGLFISFDAPHRGAEIPMSIQAMLRYLQSNNGDAQIKNSNIGSVAASQMLLTQRSNNINSYASQSISDYESATSAHGEFMRSINDPTNLAAIKNIKANNGARPLRTLAITNGSNKGSNATRGLPAGENYASEDYATLYYRLAFSNANNQSSIFTGNALGMSQWKHYLTEPAFVENLPGGNHDSYQQLMNVLSRADYGARDWTGEYPGHCFIPTASALGLTSININSQAGWLVTSGSSMFDETYMPERNQEHMAITMQNKAWISSALHRFGPGSTQIVSTILTPMLLQ